MVRSYVRDRGGRRGRRPRHGRGRRGATASAPCRSGDRGRRRRRRRSGPGAARCRSSTEPGRPLWRQPEELATPAVASRHRRASGAARHALDSIRGRRFTFDVRVRSSTFPRHPRRCSRSGTQDGGTPGIRGPGCHGRRGGRAVGQRVDLPSPSGESALRGPHRRVPCPSSRADRVAMQRLWRCNVCGDEGVISGWEDSPFDLTQPRSRSDDASRREIVLADPLAATLRDLRLLDTECERLVFGMRSARRGIVLTSSADDLEELIGFVAAEAKHETNRRRQKRLYETFAVMSDILNTIDSGDAASRSVEAAGRATASRDDEGLMGRWRIVETELWDREDLDLVAPAFIEFLQDRTGSFGLIAVSGRIDWRSEGIGRSVVEFSWEGIRRGRSGHRPRAGRPPRRRVPRRPHLLPPRRRLRFSGRAIVIMSAVVASEALHFRRNVAARARCGLSQASSYGAA